MDTRILKTFLLVAKLLNVTQAAEQLNFTQPAVTAQIHTLEKMFGVALFERVGKKMFLTEAGEKLIDYATRIINLCEETHAVLGSFQQGGEITLGVSTQMINYFLPPILQQLQQRLPTVSISVEVCMNTQEVLKGLVENRFDLGFIHGQNSMPQLTEVGIWREDILWVGSANLVKKQQYDQNVMHYPIVNFTVGSVFRRKFDEVVKKNISSSIEYSDSEAVKQAVLNGLGISFLPKILVQKEIINGTLVQLTEGPKLDLTISLVHHKNKDYTVPMKEILLILAAK